jgi:hypothetical protein
MNPEGEMRLMGLLAELKEDVAMLKARPMPQIMQPMQPQPPTMSQNPVIAQTSEIVSLLTALKGVIPTPPPAPTLKERLEEIKSVMDMFGGGGIDSPEGDTPEDVMDSGFLHDILEIAKLQQNAPAAPSTPAKPPTPPPVNTEGIRAIDVMPEKSEFMKYADTLIAELKPAEIDALKLAPKDMIKSKLKTARPEMTDADFEYAYKKVLAL